MRAWVPVCAGLLVACAGGTTTRVQRDLILPPGAAVMTVADNQRLVPPGILEAVWPAYPALPAGIPPGEVVVCVELVAGADGAAASMRQFAAEPSCEPPDSARSAVFFPAVAEAVWRWAFFGAAICTFVHAGTECDSDEADLEPVPMTLAYRFTSPRRDGARCSGRTVMRRTDRRAGAIITGIPTPEKKTPAQGGHPSISGARSWTRTNDPLINSQVL